MWIATQNTLQCSSSESRAVNTERIAIAAVKMFQSIHTTEREREGARAHERENKSFACVCVCECVCWFELEWIGLVCAFDILTPYWNSLGWLSQGSQVFLRVCTFAYVCSSHKSQSLARTHAQCARRPPKQVYGRTVHRVLLWCNKTNSHTGRQTQTQRQWYYKYKQHNTTRVDDRIRGAKSFGAAGLPMCAWALCVIHTLRFAHIHARLTNSNWIHCGSCSLGFLICVCVCVSLNA